MMYYQLDTLDTCKVSAFESTLYDRFFSLGMNSGDFTGDRYDIHQLHLFCFTLHILLTV